MKEPTTNRRNYYLLFCRFYNGEDENPYDKELSTHEVDKSHLPPPACMKEEYTLPHEKVATLQNSATAWHYEKFWLEEKLSRKENKDRLEEYIAYGNEDFEKGDGTPMDLKALLWNRYYHWGGNMGDQESFRQWYKQYYHSVPTNREKRAVKRRVKLMKRCHYYHGEAKNPWAYPLRGVNFWRKVFWELEEQWVGELSLSYKTPLASSALLQTLGIENYFDKTDEAKSLISHVLDMIEKEMLPQQNFQPFDGAQAIRAYENLYKKYIPLGRGIESFFSYYMGEEDNPFVLNNSNLNGLFWEWEKMCYDLCKGDGARNLIQYAKELQPGQCNAAWLNDPELPIEFKALVLYVDAMAGKWLPYDDIDKIDASYLEGIKKENENE